MLLARESSFEGIKYSASLYCEILEIYASDLKIEDMLDIAKQIDEAI
jgi:hypothetical protein